MFQGVGGVVIELQQAIPVNSTFSNQLKGDSLQVVQVGLEKGLLSCVYRFFG